MKISKYVTRFKHIIVPATAVACMMTQAQESVSTTFLGMEEVIVTATKRAESKQDIPLAISVLGSDEITNSSSNNIKDIVA